MKRRYLSLLVFLIALVMAPVVLASPFGYITGSVVIHRATPRGNVVHSAALETCYTYFGNIDYTCDMYIEHWIQDSSGYTPFGVSGPNPRAGIIAGEYSGNLRVTGDFDFCYRALLTAQSSVGSDFHMSGEVCLTPPPPRPDPSCPIVLDLDLKPRYDLSGLSNPVRFDIDADGRDDLLGWTARGANIGFLVLDRNGNGKIDNGAELFGYATPLVNGEKAGVGFDALAELDDPLLGGNEDGSVGPEDAQWGALRVWIDRDHNAVSTPGELVPLEKAGVVRLSYDYEISRRTDPGGNELRYRSSGWFRDAGGRTRLAPVYDVVFIH